MKRRDTKSRRKGMTGIVAAMFFLGVMVIPLFGFLAFEISRAMIMHAQLKHACEAAALAGVARLASSDDLATITTHTKSIQLAKEIFRMNTINQYTLNLAADAGDKSNNPGANQASIFVEFLDNNNNPVPNGNTNGKVVHVVGAWGLMPVFGGWGFFGLGGPHSIRAEGHGRVPDLDICMAFDTSGSIDDQTSVGLVNVYWDTNGTATQADDRVRFRRAESETASESAEDGNGRLYDLMDPAATGTNRSAFWIGNLGTEGGYEFRPTIRNNNSANGPPGNCPSAFGSGCGQSYSPSTTANLNDFTHQVVNINFDPATFKATYPMTFGMTTVNNIAEHVALSAGWLDSTSAFNQAHLGTNTATGLPGGVHLACDPPISIAPMSGRFNAYRDEVHKNLRPIRDAQDAAKTFFTIMNNNTDSHFAVSCFNSVARTSLGQTKSGDDVSTSWSPSGTHTRPDFGIALNPANGATNFSDIVAKLPDTCAQGSTEIAAAITQCKNWMDSGKRPGTTRTIIVFTDGMQTGGSATSAASTCRTPGYTVNTIGLSQNKVIVKDMCDLLNEGAGVPISIPTALLGGSISSTPYTPSSNGCAKLGGLNPPGKFYLVSDGQTLRFVFENLARRLCQLVQLY